MPQENPSAAALEMYNGLAVAGFSGKFCSIMKCRLVVLIAGCCLFVAAGVAKAEIYPISLDGFWISPQEVTFSQMAEVVASYEGHFSDLTDENFLLVTSYVASTLGPNSSVWIHSWNGNTYDGAPLECRGDGSITIGSPAKVQNVLIFQPQIVPEPSTAALVFPGFGILWWCLRLRGSSSARKETTATAGKSRSRFLRVCR